MRIHKSKVNCTENTLWQQMQVRVEIYIPNPVRCFNCQRYGHFKSNCSRPASCEKCGQEGHTSETCEESPRCCNCQGSHPANSKSCPKWVEEKQIQKLKALNNITYKEARDTFKSQDSQLKSYAGAVRTAKVSAATQTDMTWPRDSSFPKPITLTFAKPSEQSVTSKTIQTMTAPTKATQSKPQQQKPKIPPKPKKNQQKPKTEQTKPRNTPKIKIQTKPSKGSDDPIQLHNRFGALEEREEGEELMELNGQKPRPEPGGSTSSTSKPQVSKR